MKRAMVYICEFREKLVVDKKGEGATNSERNPPAQLSSRRKPGWSSKVLLSADSYYERLAGVRYFSTNQNVEFIWREKSTNQSDNSLARRKTVFALPRM